MRQVLLTSHGVTVARMPRPALARGTVLVRVRYSMVSIGTELATLRGDAAGDRELGQQLAAYSSLLGRYLGKAARDPKLAASRLGKMARARVARIVASRPRSPSAAPRDVGALEWHDHGARAFEASGAGLRLETDGSEWGYQAYTAAIPVPEGHGVRVGVTGTIGAGAISVGLLNEGREDWISSKLLRGGRIDDHILFDPGPAREVTLMISNGGEGSTAVDFESIGVALVPPDPGGLPHVETDDIGWNLGYSAAGEVIAVGEGISDLSPGDRVACGGAGLANHADYIVVPRNLVCRVPDGCDLRAASTTTIGTIALQGVRRAAPTLGEWVCVVGLGLLGQLTVQLLRANGCRVIGMDLDAERVRRAREAGMDAGADDAGALHASVRDLTGGHGTDRTLITAATSSDEVINLAMQVTRRKGTVVIVGDVGLNVERADFYRKEIDLLMSSSYGPGRYDRGYEEQGRDYPYAYVRWTLNRNMRAYLDMIAAHRIDVDRLIDAVVPVTRAETLYKEMAEGGNGAPLGVLLEYPDEAMPPAERPDAARITLRGHRKRPEGRSNYVLVGAGAFGTSTLVPLMEQQSERFFLTGVVSSDAVRGGNFARTHRLELVATDLAAVLDDPDVHLLVITTRHDRHAAQVAAALAAGKDVFVEKPLAITWDGLEAVSAARDACAEPPFLMVGFNRRFSPAIARLAEALDGRRTPLVINYRMSGGYIPPDHWIQTEEGGGRNLGEACHVYDVFRHLAASPVAGISASAINPKDLPYLRNDNFVATLSYDDGSVATLTYTALGPKEGLPKERIEVFCDGEAYIVDDFRSLVRAGDGAALWQSATAEKGHAEELRRVGEALAEGAPAPIPFDEIMEISAAALHIEDLLNGRWRDDDD